MIERLGWHVQASAAEAQYKPVSQEETARLHERTVHILEKDKGERHTSFHEGLTAGWQMPRPVVQRGERPPVTLTPASPSGAAASSSGPVSFEPW